MSFIGRQALIVATTCVAALLQCDFSNQFTNILKTLTILSGAALLQMAAIIPCQAADDAAQPGEPATSAQPDSANTTLPEVDVFSKLDQARDEIVPSLGATEYTVSQDRIEVQPGGSNAPFNQTALRLPGVAQDSFGQLHVRGEHANLQYRIDDVLLPEGLSGFGQTLDTRIIDTVSLITGALPAQFGYRTAGIMDIHTKTGTLQPGGEVSLYGGSYDTIEPSFQYGNTTGKLTYYFTGEYLHNDLGIENPTSSIRPLHDYTDQYKDFGYLSYLIDDTSRLSLMLSAAHSAFQIPNNPGQPPQFTVGMTSTSDSALLNETQTEQNYYDILSYQKTAGDLNLQVAVFTQYSDIAFKPDPTGDLIFNGVASAVDRSIFSNGIQADASYKLNEQHTLRGGAMVTVEAANVKNSDAVFATDAAGNQIGTTPFTIVDNSSKDGYLYGVYLQDEWKPWEPLAINFGGRFDVVNAYTNENQLSPRINAVYNPTQSTTLHLGYARYFTPPPLELVKQESVAKFAGTTNASEVMTASPVTAERSNYFDAGISQKVTDSFTLGIDGYYKNARQQLDEGQFGQAVIFSPFNYKYGEVYGTEFIATYEKDGFATYLNLAYSHATGREIDSGQFQFGQAELNYIAKNNVFLDHDQRITASGGVSYSWSGTRAYLDGIYGSGLRKGFANTQKGQAYATANIGIEHTFNVGGSHHVKVRLDVVNLFDKIYELRDGSGIGVGAPQFGARRGIYTGVAYDF